MARALLEKKRCKWREKVASAANHPAQPGQLPDDAFG
jgi:hypothetical protein